MSESFLAAMRARQCGQQPGAPLSLSTAFSPKDAVLSSPELMSEIFGYILSLMDRGKWRGVSHQFRRIFDYPAHWTAVELWGYIMAFGKDGNTEISATEACKLITCFPRDRLVSLALHCDIHYSVDAVQFVELMHAKPFSNLTELCLKGALMELPCLAALLQGCSGTLQRLDISAMRIWYRRSGEVAGWTSLGSMNGSASAPVRDSLLTPLTQLKVLVARDVDSRTTSWLLKEDTLGSCSALKELNLGWAGDPASEMEIRDSTDQRDYDDEADSALMKCRILEGNFCSRLTSLTSVRLAGYSRLDDAALHHVSTLPLVTLDISWCGALTDEGIARTLVALAPTLQDLNVCKTSFGDAAAIAFASAGGNICRLNVARSECRLEGLGALLKASDRLIVLTVTNKETLHADDYGNLMYMFPDDPSGRHDLGSLMLEEEEFSNEDPKSFLLYDGQIFSDSPHTGAITESQMAELEQFFGKSRLHNIYVKKGLPLSEVIERAITECYAPGKVILEKKVVTLVDKEEFGFF